MILGTGVNVTLTNPVNPDVTVATPAPQALIVGAPVVPNVTVTNPAAPTITLAPPVPIGITLVPVAGPPGPTAATFYYEHVQALASAGWSIVHNLGKFPNVSVIVGGEIIGVPVIHVDLNTAYVSFSTPQTGEAICS